MRSMMYTHRQYTNDLRVKSLSEQPDISILLSTMNRAEELIDLFCGDYIRPSNSAPYYDVESWLDGEFDGNILTINSSDQIDNDYLKYCTVTIEETGEIYPILNNTNLTVTLANAESETGFKSFMLKQIGKFPRMGDCQHKEDGTVKKWIPEEIRQASTYQAWFMTIRSDLFDNTEENSIYNSETIGRAGNYSYTGASPDVLKLRGSSIMQLANMLSPQAKVLLQKYMIQGLY